MRKRDRRPTRSLSEVRANLSAYSRDPFLDVLARFLDCQPDEKSIREWAKQYPDRWANALRALGQLSGYREHIEIENNIFMTIHSMSDAQLMEHLTRFKPVLELTADPSNAQNSGDSEIEKEQEKTP